MMALEEIAVADIRKGQKILVLRGVGTEEGEHSEVYIAQRDFDGSLLSRTRHYLIEDVPQTPPFEVPWGTVQRDKDGDVWEFLKQKDKYGNVARCREDHMQAFDAREYAPFTRLYTVPELIDVLHVKSSSGYGGTASVLSELNEQGII